MGIDNMKDRKVFLLSEETLLQEQDIVYEVVSGVDALGILHTVGALWPGHDSRVRTDVSSIMTDE